MSAFGDPSEMSGYSPERTFCAIGDGLITDDGTAVAFDPNVKRLVLRVVE